MQDQYSLLSKKKKFSKKKPKQNKTKTTTHQEKRKLLRLPHVQLKLFEENEAHTLKFHGIYYKEILVIIQDFAAWKYTDRCRPYLEVSSQKLSGVGRKHGRPKKGWQNESNFTRDSQTKLPSKASQIISELPKMIHWWNSVTNKDSQANTERLNPRHKF